MKRYSDLTEKQQQKAHEKCFEKLVELVSIGAIRFDDKKNSDNLQARIDVSLVSGKFDKETEEELRDMAKQDAEEAFYPQAFDQVVWISLEE
jgi:hypothetical protein